MYRRFVSSALTALLGAALAQGPVATLERTINLNAVGQTAAPTTPVTPTSPDQLAANLTRFALNPQGRFLVSGSTTGTLLVWDLQTRSVVGRLEGHRARVNALAYSRDGTRLVSGDVNGNLRLWNMGTRRQVGLVSIGEGVEVLSLAFSPNGQRIAVGSEDNSVRVVNAANMTVLGRMTGHSDFVRGVAFSPNGAQIASGSDDETVRLWDANRRTLIATLRGHGDYVRSVAFSPDGRTLASASDDETVKLWSLATRREVGRLRGELFVDSLSFSPDGRYLAAAEADGDAAARIWSVSTRQVVRQLPNSPELNWVAFNPSGQLYAAAEDNTIRAFNLQGQEQVRLSGAYGPRIVEEEEEEDSDGGGSDPNHEVSRLTVDGGGNLLVGYFNQKSWDSVNTQTWAVTRHQTSENTSDLAVAGNTVFVLQTTEFIGLWEGGKLVGRFATPADNAQFAQVSPDGGLLGVVAYGEEESVEHGYVFNLSTGRASRFDTGISLVAVAMGADNQTVAFGGEGKLGVWNLETRERRQEFVLSQEEETVLALRFSPDGSLLAAGLSGGRVVVFDMNTQAQVGVLEGHTEDVYDVVFSPDGKLLASAGQDNKAIIWSVGSYRKLQELTGHTKGLGSLVFSPDGTRLYTGGFDGAVRVWKITPQ